MSDSITLVREACVARKALRRSIADYIQVRTAHAHDRVEFRRWFKTLDWNNYFDWNVVQRTMASRFPKLETSSLPPISDEEAKDTSSPARGLAMKNNLLKQLRPPEFRFVWQFWAEKGTASSSTAADSSTYENRPKPLSEQIKNVKDFFQYFNHMPLDNLKLRDSIHLFHHGVKPLWEDPRNARGGAFYFRVPKDVAAQFWKEICALAIGDVLQSAVETNRQAFNDDICGVSYSVRWNAVQIAVWNRDADNEAGKQKLLETILEGLSEEVKPKDDKSYWYKKHSEHKGFIQAS